MTPTLQHAALFLDHEHAKIFHIDPEDFDVSKVAAPHHHRTRKEEERGHHEGHDHFFHDVAELLKDVKEILVVGPSSAKLDFLRYVQKHEHLIEAHIVGVETLDHPTDGQLVAYVRHYFLGKDKMLGVAR